jgi:hypothetical protein
MISWSSSDGISPVGSPLSPGGLGWNSRVSMQGLGEWEAARGRGGVTRLDTIYSAMSDVTVRSDS